MNNIIDICNNTLNNNLISDNLSSEDLSDDCIICLDSSTIPPVHFSTITSDCSCNFYIHTECFIEWINKERPDQATCLMCHGTIKNIDEFIEQRYTTEYHPRKLRIITDESINAYSNQTTTIIQINPQELNENHNQDEGNYIVDNLSDNAERTIFCNHCHGFIMKILIIFCFVLVLVWHVLQPF